VLLGSLVLITVGLERLVSAYLVGAQAATWSTRVAVGGFCIAGGVVLVALLRPRGADVRREC
jgi:hypothetical protein